MTEAHPDVAIHVGLIDTPSEAGQPAMESACSSEKDVGCVDEVVEDGRAETASGDCAVSTIVWPSV